MIDQNLNLLFQRTRFGSSSKRRETSGDEFSFLFRKLTFSSLNIFDTKDCLKSRKVHEIYVKDEEMQLILIKFSTHFATFATLDLLQTSC